MNRRINNLLLSLITIASILGLKPQQGQTASSNSYTVMSLTPSWTTGIISDGVGPPGIEVADLNQDGVIDIVSCSNGYAYVLNETLSDVYDTVWYSENSKCAALALGDRDGNGIEEIYIATWDGKVIIINGDDFQILGTFNLPSDLAATDIKVANVDGDSAQEIILARSDATLVYNANNYTKEWQADGFGGSELGIGNIDNDPDIEIVVNGSPAHVLNAALKTQEWAYSGGFGVSMDVGDVDGDNRAEIAYIESWDNAYVFEGDTLTIKWHRDNLSDIEIVRVADVDEDNISEVIIGDGQWGSVSGYQGSNGADLWSIPNPEHSVLGIGVGDSNNDGENEILWGAGLTYSGKDALFVGSWVNELVQWGSDDLDGPLYVATGDLDNDGSEEIVMASTSTSGYMGGTLRVYNGTTRQMKWSTVISGSFYDVTQLAVGQLDADTGLEILIGVNNWYDTRLQVYDGSTLTLEWESPEIGGGSPSALSLINLDADPVDEIVLGLDGPNIQILNGASSLIQWDSGILDGAIRDFALGDLDGNTKLDIAVLTDQSVYVFEVGTWTQKLHEALEIGNGLSSAKVAITNGDLTGVGELLIFTADYSGNGILQARHGVTHSMLWEELLGNVVVNKIGVEDFDADGTQEFALMGNFVTEGDASSLFWVGSHTYPGFWEYKMDGNWGSINSLSLADVENDEQAELLLGSSALIQVNELITSSVTIHRNFLPVVSVPHPPRGLYGTVTQNGVSVGNVYLELRFYDGSSWYTMMTTYSKPDGSYSFMNVPPLGSGQYYYVLFQNNSGGNGNSPDRLWTWHTQAIDNTSSLIDFHIGDFDLANITLVSPINGATVNLPATFQWIPRPATPIDSYEFNLYDPNDFNPYFYTDPPLGYVGQYNVIGLPSGFVTGDLYGWEIWVYSLDGGFGISYEVRTIYFAGLNNKPSQHLTPTKPFHDLEDTPLR